MWQYERKLQYPVKIKNTNPDMASMIISQYGGPDGELGAAMRYLSQRYTAANNQVKGVLTDVGREVSEMFLSETIAFLTVRRTVNASCNRIAPFHREQVQVNINVVLVVHHHSV